MEPELEYYPDFITNEEASELQCSLASGILWKQRSIRMFGKSVPMPRLTAWYGDEGAVYTYSRLTETPLAWTADLNNLRNRIAGLTGCTFNSVLLNLYRGGSDSMGWHSDDEPELGPYPVIASVSLGASRRMDFATRQAPVLRYSLELAHGSLLIMKGRTQALWRHRVPKRMRAAGQRINLTFRNVKPVGGR